MSRTIDVTRLPVLERRYGPTFDVMSKGDRRKAWSLVCERYGPALAGIRQRVALLEILEEQFAGADSNLIEEAIRDRALARAP